MQLEAGGFCRHAVGCNHWAVALRRHCAADRGRSRKAAAVSKTGLQATSIAEAVPEAIAAKNHVHAERLSQDNGQLQQAAFQLAANDMPVVDPEDFSVAPGELTSVDTDSPEAAADVYQCLECASSQASMVAV